MSCVVTLPGLYRIASPEINIATFNERRIGSEGFWWMVCTLVVSRVEMTFLTGKHLLSKKFPMERLTKEIDVFFCVYFLSTFRSQWKRILPWANECEGMSAKDLFHVAQMRNSSNWTAHSFSDSDLLTGRTPIWWQRHRGISINRPGSRRH